MFWLRHKNKTNVISKLSIRFAKKLKSGFVLMEALIAVIILATSLTLIIQSLGQSVRIATYSAEYVPAVILLENKLAELWGQGLDDVSESKLPPPFDKYQFELSDAVVPTENQGRISLVDLSIQWPSGRTIKSVKTQTYLLLPTNENPEPTP